MRCPGDLVGSREVGQAELTSACSKACMKSRSCVRGCELCSVCDGTADCPLLFLGLGLGLGSWRCVVRPRWVEPWKRLVGPRTVRVSVPGCGGWGVWGGLSMLNPGPLGGGS